MGIIYIFTNEAMPGLVKIGKIASEGRAVEDRMKELDTTGVPMPFECFAAWEVENVMDAENALHHAFADHRLRKRREFFRISPDKPTAILKAFGTSEVTPTTDIVLEDSNSDDDRQALDRERVRRQKFSFSVVGIEPGAELRSVFDDEMVCIVEDERKVTFRGDSTSVSGAALIIARETGREWNTINGPAYWKFNGKTLAELKETIGESQD